MARLSDLYQVEKEVTVGDGEKSVNVILRKVTPVQMETIRRRAKATQVLVSQARSNHSSDMFLEQLGNVIDVLGDDKDRLVDLVAEANLAKEIPKIQGRVMDGEGSEWAEDDYLKGLFDAWDERMSARFAEDPDDVEAKKVHDEIERFTKQVDASIDETRQNLKADLQFLSVDMLQEDAAETLLERTALTMWRDEFTINRVFFATRNDDKDRSLYFDSIQDVRDLDERVVEFLDEEYESMSVDPVEGKDLPQPESSSRQPESDKTADTATSGPSGAVAVLKD